MHTRTRLYTILMILLVGAAIIPFHLNPDAFLADDAYFYLQVADNVRQGFGSTFHEITPTNGFHPLWLLCCVAGAFVAGGDKTQLLQLMGVVQDVLFLASLYLLWTCGRRLQLSFYALGVLVLALVMVLVGGLRLFEAPLALMLQLAILSLFLRAYATPTRQDLAAIGVLMGLCMLARLDTVFFCGVVWFCLLPSLLKQPFRTSALLALTLPPCLLLIPYLAYNFAHFGHFVPISGVIKTSFPTLAFSYEHLGLHGGPAVVIALSLGVCAYFSERSRENRLCFGILLSAVALHALYIAMLSVGSQWYYTTAYITIALALMRLMTSFWHSLAAISRGLADTFRLLASTATILLFAFFLGISLLKTTYHFSIALVAAGKESLTAERAETPAAKRLAQRLKQDLPPKTAIFTFDYPGMIAYYSGMRIVPLDGLMNDFDYNAQIAQMGIADYARRHGIGYVIGPIVLPEKKHYRNAVVYMWAETDQSIKMQVVTPIGQHAAGTLTLANDQMLFKMPNPVATVKHDFPEVALWRIKNTKSF